MANQCLVILQARCSSTRLPGKVLKPILGQPMIMRQIERIKQMREPYHLVVATSDDSSDDILAAICELHGVDVFRGSLHDVLDRYYHAAKHYQAEHIMRVTADCPLFDAAIADELIRFYFAAECDYASNTMQRSFPDGMDVEMFRFSALEAAWQQAETTYQREHVTPYIHEHIGQFRCVNYVNHCNLADVRLTVDTAADFDHVTEIYQALYQHNKRFALNDIVTLMQEQQSHG